MRKAGCINIHKKRDHELEIHRTENSIATKPNKD